MKEHNRISISIQNYEDMNNTERLRHLSIRFTIQTQYLLRQLDESSLKIGD